MKNHFFKCWLVTVLLAFHFSAMAEDIDLFIGASPSATEVPNVLIIVDNTANWSGAFTNEMKALRDTISGLLPDRFRVGIMLANETGSPNNNTKGGYVRAAIRLMNKDNITEYQKLIDSFSKTGDVGNGGISSLVMAEAYRYFSAGAPYAGNGKVKTDYTGNALIDAQGGTVPSRAVYALAGNALASFNGTQYVSPISAGCQKSFIIYLSNGASQDNNSVTTQANSMLTAAGGSTTTIPLSPSGSQGNASDEWARFMKNSSLAVTTYTIDVDKVTTGQGSGWTALLKSMARISGGKYFDVNSTTGDGSQITDALTGIFSEIQSVNSVFASVSLPVSVNTQGTYLNQVYIGMFRPDQDTFPRWSGNLKQYKLGYPTGSTTLQLLDADSSSAISSGGSGFIAECARSFWSTPDTYWSFVSIQNGCLSAETSNSPDGNIVEKGAQAQMLRSTTRLNVQTCSPTSCTNLTNFNNSNVSQAMLGAASTVERDVLINWLRGQDVQDENTTDGISPTPSGGVTTSTVMRPSAHGDVVHSRPVAINYGTDTSPQVVVFYGGNDGILRAVNGNRPDKPTPNIGTVTPGSELWSFVAPEFYPKIKRIYDNTPQISFPEQALSTPPPSVLPSPKDYGVDGPVTAYKDGSTAYIYATMRRGGSAVYAFNVNSPASPSLKWKKDASSLAGLGQTWSSPKVLKSSGYGAGASPMLIMGGGYDTCHDVDGNTNGCGSNGKKIYVLDANTGTLLQTFNTDSSVIADITVVPDSTGLAKYAYAADLGGNVYRISGATANTPIGTTAPGSWTITKIAALGGSGSNNRKFMFAPDVVAIDSDTYGVLLGSGDREKPLIIYISAAAVANRFFMIKDKPTDAGWLSTENSNCGGAVICNASLFAITTSATPTETDLTTKPKGWYLALAPTEQVVTSAITVFGTVTFSTQQPAVAVSGICRPNLGTAIVYNINYTNAAPLSGQTDRGATIVGGGLPPSPVAGMVTLDDGKTVSFIIGASPQSGLQGGAPSAPPAVRRPRGRVYWNIKK